MENAIGVTGLLLALLAIFVGYRQSAAGQRLAKRELKSGPALRFRLNRSLADHIVWVLPWATTRRMCIIDLEMEIENAGDKTLEQVFVVMEISSAVYEPDLGRVLNGSSRLVKIERFNDPINGSERSRITYFIDAINPNVALLLTDFLVLGGSSRISNEVPVTTADGVDALVKWNAVLAFSVLFTITAKDIQPIKRGVELLTFDFSDPLVANMQSFEDVPRIVNANKKELGKRKSARVFFVEELEQSPDDVPIEIRDKFVRARLKNSRWGPATYLPDIGYLPIDLS